MKISQSFLFPFLTSMVLLGTSLPCVANVPKPSDQTPSFQLEEIPGLPQITIANAKTYYYPIQWLKHDDRKMTLLLSRHETDISSLPTKNLNGLYQTTWDGAHFTKAILVGKPHDAQKIKHLETSSGSFFFWTEFLGEKKEDGKPIYQFVVKGLHWKQNQLVQTPSFSETIPQNFLSFHLGPKNQIIATWGAYGKEGSFVEKISAFNGVSWSTSLSFTKDLPGETHDVQIWVPQKDQAIITWIQEDTYQPRHIYYLTYDGTTWSLPQFVPGQTGIIPSYAESELISSSIFSTRSHRKQNGITVAFLQRKANKNSPYELTLSRWEHGTWKTPATVSSPVSGFVMQYAGDGNQFIWYQSNNQKIKSLFATIWNGSTWSTHQIPLAKEEQGSYIIPITIVSTAKQQIAFWAHTGYFHMDEGPLWYSLFDGNIWSDPQKMKNMPVAFSYGGQYPSIDWYQGPDESLIMMKVAVPQAIVWKQGQPTAYHLDLPEPRYQQYNDSQPKKITLSKTKMKFSQNILLPLWREYRGHKYALHTQSPQETFIAYWNSEFFQENNSIISLAVYKNSSWQTTKFSSLPGWMSSHYTDPPFQTQENHSETLFLFASKNNQAGAILVPIR